MCICAIDTPGRDRLMCSIVCDVCVFNVRLCDHGIVQQQVLGCDAYTMLETIMPQMSRMPNHSLLTFERLLHPSTSACL